MKIKKKKSTETLYIAWSKVRSILNWTGIANLLSEKAGLNYTLIRFVCTCGEKFHGVGGFRPHPPWKSVPEKEEENGVTEDRSWREKRGWSVTEEAICFSDGEELHKQISVAFFGHFHGETHAYLCARTYTLCGNLKIGKQYLNRNM